MDETTALLRLANAKLDLLITRSESQGEMAEASAERERQMALDLTGLRKDVEANKDAVQGVVTVIERLATQLEVEKEDPAAVQAIVDQLRANTQSLATAVTKNTPAEGGGGGTTPPPTPTPPAAAGQKGPAAGKSNRLNPDDEEGE